MKKCLIVSGAVCFIFIGLSPAGWAGPNLQSLSPSSVKGLSAREWKTTIDDIKAQTKTLLEENEKLVSEYDFLQDNLAGLQDSLNSLRQEIARQQRENRQLGNRQKDEEYHSARLERRKKDLRQEAADLETDNARLKEQLAEVEAENSRLQDRLSALKDQKRQVVLDVKMQEFLQTEGPEPGDEELGQLQAQLQEYLEKEQELNAVRQELEERSGLLPAEIEKVKRENRELASQIDELRALKDRKEAEIARMEKDNQRLENSAAQLPRELVKERDVLEKEVQGLESRLDIIRQAIEESTDVLKRKKALMDEIMQMDAQNQALRSQVSNLMQQVKDADAAAVAPVAQHEAQKAQEGKARH